MYVYGQCLCDLIDVVNIDPFILHGLNFDICLFYTLYSAGMEALGSQASIQFWFWMV
jgi:hypothetical protein